MTIATVCALVVAGSLALTAFAAAALLLTWLSMRRPIRFRDPDPPHSDGPYR